MRSEILECLDKWFHVKISHLNVFLKSERDALRRRRTRSNLDGAGTSESAATNGGLGSVVNVPCRLSILGSDETLATLDLIATPFNTAEAPAVALRAAAPASITGLLGVKRGEDGERTRGGVASIRVGLRFFDDEGVPREEHRRFIPEADGVDVTSGMNEPLTGVLTEVGRVTRGAPRDGVAKADWFSFSVA